MDGYDPAMGEQTEHSTHTKMMTAKQPTVGWPAALPVAGPFTASGTTTMITTTGIGITEPAVVVLRR